MANNIEMPTDVSWEEARLLLFNEINRLDSSLNAAHDKIRKLENWRQHVEDGQREKRIKAGAKGGLIGTLLTILLQVIMWAIKVYTK